MGEAISWFVELEIKPGKLNDLQRLTGEMVEAARGEAGVLSYQRFVSDDGRSVYVYERYTHSAAAAMHLRMFMQTFGDRFGGMVNRKRFIIFGEPTAKLKSLLDRFGATYLKPFGPFEYWP
jgi:quinol monooxygenase YgiN